MQVVIVDDEELALSRLKRLLVNESIENIESFNNPEKALEWLAKNRCDLIFLDIAMPQMSGLELANRVMEKYPNTFIIFQSAYDEHALEAFQSGGIDYLLKPIEQSQIKETLSKVENFRNNTSSLNNRRLMGKRGSSIYLIDIKDIFYIKADLDEVLVRIKESDVYVKKKIGELDKLLTSSHFFRIHRSYMVNINKIKSMESVDQSKLQIAFNGIDDTITSSKEGAKEFREYLERRSL